MEDEALLCPHDVETATGHFDPVGPDPAGLDPGGADDCAGCGCPRREHVRPDGTAAAARAAGG